MSNQRCEETRLINEILIKNVLQRNNLYSTI